MTDQPRTDRIPSDAGPVADPGRVRAVPGEGFSVVELANLLLRHRSLLIMLPGITLLAATAMAMARGREYMVTSKFMAQDARRTEGNLASVAMQFGLGTTNMSESPAFYASLVMSNGLLREAAATEYQLPDGGSGLLAELYGLDVTGDAAVEASLRMLRKRLRVTTERATGLVNVSTAARWPALATVMNVRLLELVNEFNLRRRQSRATAERRFTEARLEHAQTELEQAEGALQRFLQQNRQYEGSPQLVFEVGRLQRRVDLQQQVYVSLAQSNERARIEEVRNTPVITVVDQPGLSFRWAGRHPMLDGILAMIAAGIVAVGIVISREYLAREATRNPQAYQEFRALSGTAVEGVRRRFAAWVGRL